MLSVLLSYYLVGNYLNFKNSKNELNKIKENNIVSKLRELISTERSLSNNYLRGKLDVADLGAHTREVNEIYGQVKSSKYSLKGVYYELEGIFFSLGTLRDQTISQSLGPSESNIQYSKILENIERVQYKLIKNGKLDLELGMLNDLDTIKLSLNNLRDLMIIEFSKDMPLTSMSTSTIIKLKTSAETGLSKGKESWGEEHEILLSHLLLSKSWSYLETSFLKLINLSGMGNFNQNIEEFDSYYQYIDKTLTKSTQLQRKKNEILAQSVEHESRTWFLKSFLIIGVFLGLVWYFCNKVYRGLMAHYLWSVKAQDWRMRETIFKMPMGIAENISFKKEKIKMKKSA